MINKLKKKLIQIGDYQKSNVIINEDSKKRMKKKNKFTLFASLLDNDKKRPTEKIFSSLEEAAEYKKLAFFWEKCLTKEETSNIWIKTQQKIAVESTKIAVFKAEKERYLWLNQLKYVSIAASVALLIGFAYFYSNDSDRNNLDVMEQLLQVGTMQDMNEVTLVVSDEKKISLDNNVEVVYSAAGDVKINSDILQETDEKNIYNQIIVPKGKRSQLVLADNSKIWINSGSKVIYPRSFKGNYREIYIEGEVYLKVVADAKKPFIVKTSDFEVRVLGTSFNISAYKSCTESSIVLVDGLVDVKDRNERHIKMFPNERVALSKTGVFGKEAVNALDYIGWIDGVWSIQGESLGVILQRLQEYYGREIQCEALIEDEKIFGKLYLNNDLDVVMKSLMSTLPIQYTAKNNVIYVKKN